VGSEQSRGIPGLNASSAHAATDDSSFQRVTVAAFVTKCPPVSVCYNGFSNIWIETDDPAVFPVSTRRPHTLQRRSWFQRRGIRHQVPDVFDTDLTF
jgi:hypothetical protein